MAKTCSIKGCLEEHHAKGFCNRHYKKFVKYEDPQAGRFNEIRGPRETKQQQPAPEPKKPRLTNIENYNFFINQKTIERLYMEAVKAKHDPLYKIANGDSVFYILRLAAILSGYNKKNTAFIADFLAEPEEWAECKDKIRFMSALANWEIHFNKYEAHAQAPFKNVTQLSLFSRSQSIN